MFYAQRIPHGIMFHHFHNAKHPKSQGSVSQDDFKRVLDYISQDRIISPDEWMAKLSKKNLNSGDLCLTFDDGLSSQIEIALPVLEHLNLKAFWFVYSCVFEGTGGELEIYRLFRTKYFETIDDFYEAFFKKANEAGYQNTIEEKIVKEQQKLYPFYSARDIKFRFLRDKILGFEKYKKLMDSLLEELKVSKEELSKNLWMSNKNLKYLADNGHAIGLHSYSHPTALAELSSDEQYDEYKKNYVHLERVCGRSPTAMSHPCNSYNEDTLKVLRELGIRCGFRANMFSQHGDTPNASDFEMYREDHANLMRTL